jgi:hypothetical protein
MKRKVYNTRRERMTDQIIGFLAFPLVNVTLWISLLRVSEIIDSQLLATLVSALPWLVNGSVVALALLLRPEFGVGYIAFIGVAVAVVMALGVLVVAACFVIIPLAPVIGDLANWVFIFLVAAGLFKLSVFAIHVFQDWWSSDKNNSH